VRLPAFVRRGKALRLPCERSNSSPSTSEKGPPDGRVLRLPKAISPIDGEPLLSLLTRAATENGFHRIEDILVGAHINEGRPDFIAFTQSARIDAIAQMLRVDRMEVSSRMHLRISDKKGDDLVNWFGTAIPRHCIESKRRRVSPRSLRNSPHHRAQWMIRPLQFCPESMEMLISSCGSCQKELRWATTYGQWRCERCGASLRRHQPGKVPWALRRELREIADLISPAPDIRSRAVSILPCPFSAWDHGDVFVGLLEITILSICATHNVDTAIYRGWRLGDFSYATPSALVDGYRIMCSWTDEFPRLVKSIADVAPKSGPSGLRATLGPLHKFLKEQKVMDTAIRRLIIQEIPKIIRDQGIPIKRLEGSRVFGHEREDYISAKEATKQVGIDGPTCRRLNTGGECVVASASSRYITLYDKKHLARSVNIWRGSFSPLHAARLLGVPAYTLPEFVNQGLLDAVTDHDALLLGKTHELYIQATVEGLANRIAALADKAAAQNGVSIYSALTGRRFEPGVWAAIFAAIQNKRLILTGTKPGAQMVSKRFLVEPSELMDIVSGTPRTEIPEVEVSCETAADVVHSMSVHLADAFRAGILPGRRYGTRILMYLRKVQAFDQQYVMTKELQRKLGCGATTVYRRLLQAGVSPAYALSNTNLWRRDEAMRTLLLTAERGARNAIQ
jgi:hypothetical protein